MKKSGDPVQILRSLLERVQARRAASVHPEDQQAEDQAHAAGGQLVPDYKGRDIYISFDGDNIGNAVARAESKDDEDALMDISQRIQRGQDLFVDFLVHHQGRLVEAGGDEGLGRCSSNCLADVEEFRQRYKDLVGATVTVGVGEKISQATKARMLGKLRGKDQVCYYDESTESELEIRTQQGGHEAEKLGQAGLLEGYQQTPKFGIGPSQQQDWQQEYDEPEAEEEQQQEQDQEQEEDQEPEQQDAQESQDEDNSEYYDYTDLPFGQKEDLSHRRLAEKIAREEGANPRFLHLASRNLFRR